MSCRRTILSIVLLSLLALVSGCNYGAIGPAGPVGAQGSQGPPGGMDPGKSVEACISCHGPGRVVPVVSITDPNDAHQVDTDPLGPRTASGYRRLNVAISSVDVTGSSVIMSFTVTDELGGTVDNLFAADGRFTVARLMQGVGSGDSNLWDSLIVRSVTGAPGTPAAPETTDTPDEPDAPETA
mgnify:CR=1 FL=1